ncbi:hypothetical protein A2Y85_01775 [candidate division WOR-3 bacterium RBG_13_43_14]|uniref:TonB-dependent receptor n=1 Tax=candidate division WOR-3 bacterium RBG_13_43_14 TaxID=1802590 RepID=A0A1F4UCH5_UNCW3|nr:MAG: hypothetical protein A2Y85_01775 [candidate division WOR-3 bacterium RBG_13_43_14]
MMLLLCLLSLTDAVYDIDEIVVTATRYPAAVKELPVATIVIDKKDIEAANAKDLNEVLQKEAGIDIKDYGGALSSVTIRGIQANGILVLINGRPFNSITTGMANISAININTVERIEIVKGAASNVYGANALGGVINIITRRDLTRPEMFMQAQISSIGNDASIEDQDFFARIGYPLGRFIIETNGGYRASNGFRINTDFKDYNFSTGLIYELTDVSIAARVNYGKKDYGTPGPMLADSTSYSPLDRESDVNILNDLDCDWMINQYLQWSNKIYLDRRQTDFNSFYVGYNNDTIVQNYYYLTNTLGISSILDYQFGNSEWAIGIDGRYDSLDADENAMFSDTSWQVSSFSVGAWFEINKRISERSLILTGLRLDYYPDFGIFLSPQVGLTGSISEWLIIKMSTGRAFRAPTFNDLYYPLSGNPELKPEHGWAYELRIESTPTVNSFIALSGFHRLIIDRIAWMPADNMFWEPQNLNNLNVKGIEIETLLRSRNYGFELGATYLDSEQQNDEIVYDFYDWPADTSHIEIENISRGAAFVPLYNLTLKTWIKLPYAMQLGASFVQVGERVNYYPDYSDYPNVFMQTKTLNAYQIIDLSIERNFFGKISFVLGAKNLLNTAYATQFGYSIDDLDYPMPGRSIFARVKVKI